MKSAGQEKIGRVMGRMMLVALAVASLAGCYYPGAPDAYAPAPAAYTTGSYAPGPYAPGYGYYAPPAYYYPGPYVSGVGIGFGCCGGGRHFR
jgi:hypothetical protein